MDILLDRETHDIIIKDGDLLLLNDFVDLVRQRVKQRLLTIKGEWFLNEDIGLPFFTEIFNKQTPFNRISALFLRTIKKTQGVKDVEKFELDGDPKERILKISFQAKLETNQNLIMEVTV